MLVERGSQLGPYEILEPLGSGGMGEVWKARDTRLDRLVAVKILSAQLAGDADMRRRLEREARAVAALSHPNICVLHDVGEIDGTEYLVMELLDGETLAEKIARGPFAFDALLKIAIQIAAALDRAHRAGVVHRDLKPGNVMLTRSGAKLLDFGLARVGVKTGSGPIRPGLAADVPPQAITQQGMVVGTIHYMAPEQLEGKDADARSDLFSLGAVLYEMATGRRAFTGQSHASLISAVLMSDPPPLLTLRPAAPPALERLVRTCLAKDPEERWQSAYDVKRELEWIAMDTGDPRTAPFPGTVPGAKLSRSLSRALLPALAGALAGAALLALVRRAPPAPAADPVRFVISLPPGDSVGTLMRSALAFSPDGRRLAFVGFHGDKRQIFLRSMDTLEVRPLPGTERADAPFFSPDGEWLGFFGDGKLKKVSIAAGVASVVCDAPEGRGGSWGEDGSILFAPAPPSGLHRVSAAGGVSLPVTRPDAAAGENSHRWPELLPGGKGALFTIRTDRIESFDDAKVAAISLPGGRIQTLVEGGTHPHFVPPGTLLYARAGVVYAAPFDPAAMRITGPARRLVDGVSTNPTAGGVALAASRSGALAWVAGSTEVPKVSLRWVSAAGEEPPLAEFRRRVTGGALSPDRGRLVVRIAAANDDLWSYDIARGNLARLTSEPGDEVAPIWTPDGTRVVFAADGGHGAQALFAVASDGSERPVPLHRGADDENPSSFTPDGRTLLFDRPKGVGGGDVMSLTLATGAVRPFLATSFRERNPAVSPDGSLVAYVSNESGRDEVYVQPWPGPGGKWTISTEGGDRPLWLSRDELSFRSERRRMSVRIGGAPPRTVSSPRRLFDEPYSEIYGVSADGKRFLVLKNEEPLVPATQIVVQLGKEPLK